MYQARELPTVPGEYTGLERAEVQGPPRPGGMSMGANLTKIGQGVQLPCQMYIMGKRKNSKTIKRVQFVQHYVYLVSVSPRQGGSFHKSILSS